VFSTLIQTDASSKTNASLALSGMPGFLYLPLWNHKRLKTRTAGAKAQHSYVALSARLKSCPDTKHEFFRLQTGLLASCKVVL
jgi:hypothetical protein